MPVNTNSLYLQLSVTLGKEFSYDNDLDNTKHIKSLSFLEEVINIHAD